MDVYELLPRYRGRLAFHGGLSMQRILPFGTWDQTNNGLHLGADHCGSEAWFPAAGLRHPDDGKLYGVGESGYIWTRQSVAPDSVRQHYFLYNISGYSYARIYLSLPSARACAQSVRCVRE